MFFKGAESLESKYLQILLIISILLFGFLCRFAAINFFPKSLSPDEKTYVNFSTEIRNKGLLSGVRESTELYNASQTQRLYPMPTRVGYTGFLAFSFSLFQNHPLSAEYFSLICSFLTLTLLVLFANSLIGGYGAYTTGVIGIFFLPSVETGRRIWSESLIELLFVLLLLASLLIIKHKKVFSIYSLPYFIVAVGIFFVKESALVILFLAGLSPLVFFLYQSRWAEAIKFITLNFLALILAFCLLSYVIGGSDILIQSYQNHRLAHSGNSYAALYQDGTWLDFFKIFYILSPGTFLLLCLGGPILLLCNIKNNSQRKDLNLLSLVALLMVLFFVIICSIPDFYINFRLLSPVYPLIIILSSLPLALLLQNLSQTKNVWCFIGVNFLLFLFVIYNFKTLWNYLQISNCQDFSLRLIKECLQIVN